MRMDTPALRRSLRRLSAPLALLLAVLVAAIAPQACAACSCLPLTFAEAADRADVVFVGTATGRADGPDGELGPTVDYTFTVSEVYTGDVPAETVVRTADNSAACGFAFESGEAYVVMARSGPDGLETDLCTGTALAADVAGEDLDALGPAAAPGPAEPGGVGGGADVGESGSARPWFVAGGAALGALLTGLVLAWQRRRGSDTPAGDAGPETRRSSPGEALPHTEAT